MYHSYSSEQIEISLLTCSSGSESFTTWGHSALRIIDNKNKIDVVYNFGLFDFNTPNFYSKFIKGKLKYKLGVHGTDRFFRSYLSDNRQIIEQKLDLSDEDKVKIIQRLEYLYKPENRYYYYDFLRKNCTTELRDLIFENIETDFQDKNTNKTYRDQLNEFMINKPWLKLGINLIFGTSVDEEVTAFQSMFLPDYLCLELNNVKVSGKELVYSQQIINEVEDESLNYPVLLNPILIFSVLLLIVLMIKSSKIQLPVFIITGLLGLLILTVWSITEHLELKGNFNILWCNPLYLIFLFPLKKNKIKLYLSIVLQIMIIGIVIVWISNIQSFEIAFIPVVLILSIYNIRAIKKSVEIDAL
jgi:hypothetical protein